EKVSKTSLLNLLPFKLAQDINNNILQLRIETDKNTDSWTINETTLITK
ncbi:16470_t:CDS:1, partial [Cetraspora pellucida]